MCYIKFMNLEKFLRYTVIGGVFALLVTPLIVTDSLFFPFITGKNFFFRIVVEIILASWILLVLLNGAYRPKWSHLLSATTIFVGVIALADIFGVYPMRSIWSNFERMDGLMTLLHLFAYLTVAVSVLRTEKLWKRFWVSSVLVSVVVGIHAFFQYLGFSEVAREGARVDATLGNAIYLGGYMLVHFFATLWLLWDLKKRHRSGSTIWLLAFYVLALILQVSSIFLSQTRGSILGLLGGLGLFALISALFARAHPRVRKVSALVVVLLLFLVGGFFIARDTKLVQETKVLNRLANISLTEGTGGSRIILWQIAVEGFKDKPILGWGQEGYIDVFNKHYRPELHGDEPWFDRAHNIVLNWMVVGGALGVLAYLSIWVFLLIAIWSGRSRFDFVEKALLTGLLGAYFFHNLFVFDNIVTYLLFFSMIGFVHFSSTKFSEERRDGAIGKNLLSGVSTLLILVLTFSIYFLNLRPLFAARDMVDGLRLSGSDPESALLDFKQARARGFLGRFEGAVQMSLRAGVVAGADGVSSDLKEDYFNEARDALLEEIEANPRAVRARFFLGLLLRDVGQNEEAIKYLEEARKLSPKKQRLLVVLGNTYLEAGEGKKATEIFNEAYNLDTSFNELRQGAIIVSLRNGEIERAREALLDEEGGIAVATPELIMGAIEAGAFDIAKMLIEAFVEKNPRDPQSLASAAAGYLRIGERELAAQTLEKIPEIDPRLEAQVAPLIDAIEAGENPLESL